MPTSSGGFEQAYNAQAGVDVKTHLIVAQHVTQHTNDKQEIEPALAAIGQLPKALGEAENLLANTGYFSEANVEKYAEASLVPYIPAAWEKHNLPLTERFKEDPEPPQNATVVQAMRHRLQIREGKAVYATRKSTVETVFGIINHVLEFRQFLLRGLDSVQREWSLVCILYASGTITACVSPSQTWCCTNGSQPVLSVPGRTATPEPRHPDSRVPGSSSRAFSSLNQPGSVPVVPFDG